MIGKRGATWLGAFAISVIVWFSILICADVFGATPKDEPHVTGWVHIFGCPRANKDDDTNADIIVIFSNGQISHLKQHTLSEETKMQLALTLTMNGLNIVYDCGKQT